MSRAIAPNVDFTRSETWFSLEFDSYRGYNIISQFWLPAGMETDKKAREKYIQARIRDGKYNGFGYVRRYNGIASLKN